MAREKNKPIHRKQIQIPVTPELLAAITRDADLQFETIPHTAAMRLTQVYAKELPPNPNAEKAARATDADLMVKEIKAAILARNVVLLPDALALAQKCCFDFRDDFERMVREFLESLPADQAATVESLYNIAKAKIFIDALHQNMTALAIECPTIEKIIDTDPVSKMHAAAIKTTKDDAILYTNEIARHGVQS